MSYDVILHPRADRPYSAEDLRVFLSAWHRGLYRITALTAFRAATRDRDRTVRGGAARDIDDSPRAAAP